jgi:hypothetical protein
LFGNELPSSLQPEPPATSRLVVVIVVAILVVHWNGVTNVCLRIRPNPIAFESVVVGLGGGRRSAVSKKQRRVCPLLLRLQILICDKTRTRLGWRKFRK